MITRALSDILVRCIREKGIELSAEGLAEFDALADGFAAWKADPSRRGTPIAPEALKRLELAKKGLRGASVGAIGGHGVTMIERLGPKVAIGTDGYQWVVYQARAGSNVSWQGETWRPVGYIHCDKRALVSCIRAKGLKLSAAGQAARDRQDEKIHRWRLAGSTGKLEIAA